jgi:hypothetical protein
LGATLLIVAMALGAPIASAQFVEAELAGEPLPIYPEFTNVDAFNADSPVNVGVDPTRYAGIGGQTADIYVVAAQAAWSLGSPLIDAGSGAETVTFSNPGIAGNVFQVAAAGELPSDAGENIGVPYDVVIDLDQDGSLSNGDLIDGAGDTAGLYVVKDLVSIGPLPTAFIDYSVSGVTPGYSRERTWYPWDIAAMGRLPLVIISHGNGHDFRWYDYLQEHLASHGYVVMSHQNNTGPGIETASTTTLQHTDSFIDELDTIGGGILADHIDTSRITWIGHSRGGEGVARAYDRIFDGAYVPINYSLDDIVLISSIAPTDFLETDNADPHGANYHLLYGSADGDVCGCPDNDVAQSFHLLERATGYRQSTYVHGADHNDFNCCGFNDFSGPAATEVGRAEAQRVAKGAYLALIKHYVEGNVPGREYLWRQYESFKPIGVAASVTVVNEYKTAGDKFVVDDYQGAPAPNQSSSGGPVFSIVDDLAEGLLNDINFDFTWNPTDPFNGMTRAVPQDDTRGAVFTVPATDPAPRMMWLIPGGLDATQYEYLSFRACQGTRHPATIATTGDYTFVVMLADGSGGRNYINFAAYGGGIEEPYQRSGSGSGTGWQNEFETVRIRLSDFETARGGTASTLDLTDLQRIGFFFVAPSGIREVRLGVDDLELTSE